ncbi:MAG: hypothetical protein FWD51_03540, partial [Betaproteobacteria bacterium]|nr:hypothetical protein [Betaproteobacteria bacterium]
MHKNVFWVLCDSATERSSQMNYNQLINHGFFLPHHRATCAVCHNGAGYRTLYPVFPQSYPQQLWGTLETPFVANAYQGLPESPSGLHTNSLIF